MVLCFRGVVSKSWVPRSQWATSAWGGSRRWEPTPAALERVPPGSPQEASPSSCYSCGRTVLLSPSGAPRGQVPGSRLLSPGRCECGRCLLCSGCCLWFFACPLASGDNGYCAFYFSFQVVICRIWIVSDWYLYINLIYCDFVEITL